MKSEKEDKIDQEILDDFLPAINKVLDEIRRHYPIKGFGYRYATSDHLRSLVIKVFWKWREYHDRDELIDLLAVALMTLRKVLEEESN